MLSREININTFEDFTLFLYLCARHAHQTGVGFDAFFLRATFAVYILLVLFRILRAGTFKINGYLKWLALFVAYMLFTCLWANASYSLFYLDEFIQIIGITIGITTRIKNIDEVKRYLLMYYCSLIYMCILLVLKSPIADWGTDNIGSAIGVWRNEFGLYAAIGAMLSIYYITVIRNQSMIILNIIIFPMFFTIALLSRSRKALFMVPAFIVLYFFSYVKRRVTTNNILIVIGAIIVGVVLIIALYHLIMNNSILYQSIGRRVESMLNVLFNGGDEVSMSERSFYIREAEKLFTSSYRNILFGAGSNGFVAYMAQIGYSHVAYCHNNFWEILSTLGITGFAIYYYMHFKCLQLTCPFGRDDNNYRKLSALLWCALLTVVVIGWWLVYYPMVSFNYLFVVIYMAGIVMQKNQKQHIVEKEEKS